MKIITVGDSTVSKFNDVSYYYPRYGYGELLNNYFNLDIVNLALSGRSSKSFLNENNYQKFKEILNSDDVVIIGFGHNDEKDDDSYRFLSAIGLDNSPFCNNIYENYIKIAKEKNANIILVTPTPRLDLSFKYEGLTVHDTKNGNYHDAIIALAKKYNLLYVDLTNEIKNISIKLNDDQFLLHAVSKGKKKNDEIVPDIISVDKTHFNYFGAAYCAYFIAKYVESSNLELKKYIKNLDEPSKNILKMNSNFKYIDYKTPDFNSYKGNDKFIVDLPFYSTAFGDLGNKDVFFVKKENDKYILGTYERQGKINASMEGYAYLFMPIEKIYNFKFEAKLKIIYTELIRQGAVGLMLRSDVYLNQEENNVNYNSNFICAGMIETDKISYINFARENPTEVYKCINTIDHFYNLNDELNVSIERLGQVVTVKTKYQDKEYVNTFTDFDYLSKDNKYVYIGLISTCATVVEASDIKYEINGLAKEA